MTEEAHASTIEQFVWERWRHVWYMGRIVERRTNCEASESSNRSTDSINIDTDCEVRVHIHGEPETRDKWLSLASPNIVSVAAIASATTAIGTFPVLHACVELLLMDISLYDLLLRALTSSDNASDSALPLLVGRVVQVLPAHDACVVDVAYPRSYHHIVHERRVHISNGYVNAISESEFEHQQRRLAQTLGALALDE